tara:strand:- start:3697 stop:5124 length:1428 start_codon:yes stop_codon:yes gene_type:complete
MSLPKKFLSIEEVEKLSIDEVKALYSEYVNPKQTKIFSNFPFGKDIFIKAKDMYIYTSDNKKILDFTGGLGVLNHGHNNLRIKNTRMNFIKNDKMEVHKIVFSPYLAGLSHNLSNILGAGLKRTFLCNSGAEAIEGAIKLSFRASKNKKFILSSDKSYHGKLIASGSISGSLKKVNSFPKISGYDFFKFNDLNSLEEKLNELDQKGGVYAVVIEPFSATLLESCSENFINGLVDLSKKFNFTVICDEVYCAWYKCGEIFYFKKFKNFQPDIITLSKSLGGGKSSISALVANEKLYNKVYGSFETAMLHTTTYNGFGEECATAIEAINILVEEDYETKVKNLEEKIIKHLQILKDKYPKKIKRFQGAGSLYGIEFFSMIDNFEPLLKNISLNTVKNKTSLISKLNVASISSELYSKHKILTYFSESENSNFLYVAPSLIASNENIDYFFNSLDEVLKSKLDLKLLKYVINSIFNVV